uniref:Uncharacterized protein n=1 Tax=Candidatus Kentrum sp. SD TaxID=2126332 RepID=A0A450YXK5_9GAMM|nr:MAG: hypothetical protein BECKSD772E_GA0070983_10688 [Candidatus Kentron sp. SD]
MTMGPTKRKSRIPVLSGGGGGGGAKKPRQNVRAVVPIATEELHIALARLRLRPMNHNSALVKNR